MLWRFSRDLYDRRGRGQDPLLGLTSEDEITGAAPRVLAHPGAQTWAKERCRIRNHEHYAGEMPEVSLMAGGGVVHCPDGGSTPPAQDHNDSAVWEPYGLGLGPSQPEATLQAASRIAEAPYAEAPLASRRTP